MKSKILYILIGVLLNTPFCFSGQADSLCIEGLLRKSATLHFYNNSARLMFFAESLDGVPYQAGTLDKYSAETLIVRTDSLDCTTYVETVLALYLASMKQNPVYADYAEALKNIRYRGGEIHGYASRLHYFSDWVEDNEKKGILCELTRNNRHDVRVFSLNFMTEHSGLYKQLRDNDSLLSEMKQLERRWTRYEMPYIPKRLLSLPETDIKIKDGDIIALTTNIPGLDVVHLGFAVWIDGSLHLRHASSLHGKVLLDNLSLFDYLKDRKQHTGIRVIRVK